MAKVGILTPTRGDRPQFLAHAKWMIEQQTQQPAAVHIIGYPPKGEGIDLLERYKRGMQFLFEDLKCDCVLPWEDDDWYDRNYIQRMIQWWEHYNKPDLFGFNHSIYYNILLKRYRKLEHPGRASMFNTLISKDYWGIINSCPEDIRFIDIFLWQNTQNKVSISISEILCIGIKHGIGRCGGRGHHVGLYSDKNSINDSQMLWLESNTDEKSFEFYKSIHKQLSIAA